MPLKETAKQCRAIAKKTQQRCCNPAVTGYDVCRLHGAGNKRKLNQGPISHGRYSHLKRESMRKLIEHHEADPDPLNILPELAAARALFQDFVERYDQFSSALIAWHQSYQGQRPINPEKASAFFQVINDYEESIVSEDDLTDRQQEMLGLAREYIEALQESGSDRKPHQILDIGDAYRIVSEITKIVERIEKIRAANAISRPDLIRTMTEMSRVVQTYVNDEQTLEKIKAGWLNIHVG